MAAAPTRRLVFVTPEPPAEDEASEPVVPFAQRLAADFAAHHPREEAA